MNFFKKAKKGFTLVELVVVIAVIAILAAVSVGAYFGVTESANNSKAEQEAKQAYTQLQTKTLAGLELGNSGMSVLLGNNGLTFNGLYDNNVLNQFGSLVFDEGNIVEVSTMDSVINVSEEARENAQVYLFATSNSSDSAVAKYMGYVPANLSGKYVKYLNLANGEFTKAEDLEGTFKLNNYAEGLVTDTITVDIWNGDNTSYRTSYAAYEPIRRPVGSNYATYFGVGAMTKGSIHFKKSTPINNVQHSTGVFLGESAGLIKYIGVEWDNNAGNNTGKSIAVTGLQAVPYTSTVLSDVTALSDVEIPVGTINEGQTILPISDNVFYVRLTSTNNAVYLKNITFYYDTLTAVPEKSVTGVDISDTELKLGLNKTYTLTATPQPAEYADTGIVWSSSDPSKVSVDDNGVITGHAITEEPVTITAKSVKNEFMKKTCKVTVIEEIIYNAYLVNGNEQLKDGDKVVITSIANKKVVTEINTTAIHTTINDNLTDNIYTFANTDDALIFELKKLAAGTYSNGNDTITAGDNCYSFVFAGTEGERAITSPSGADLKYGYYNDLSGNMNVTHQYNFDFDANGNFLGVHALNSNRSILYQTSNSAIKNYSLNNASGYEKIQLFKIVSDPSTEPTTDYSLKSFEIETVDGSISINATQTLELQFKEGSQYPIFAQKPTDIIYQSKDTSVATVDGNKVTGVNPGNVIIEASSGTAKAQIEISVAAADGSISGYFLVTDINNITAGDKVIIVGNNTGLTLTDYNHNLKGDSNIKIENNQLKLLEGNEVVDFEVEVDSENNLYSFKNGDKYLNASTSQNADGSKHIII